MCTPNFFSEPSRDLQGPTLTTLLMKTVHLCEVVWRKGPIRPVRNVFSQLLTVVLASVRRTRRDSATILCGHQSQGSYAQKRKKQRLQWYGFPIENLQGGYLHLSDHTHKIPIQSGGDKSISPEPKRLRGPQRP